MQQKTTKSSLTCSDFITHRVSNTQAETWPEPPDVPQKNRGSGYHRLVRNTAVCLLIALGILGLQKLDPALTDGLQAATSPAADEDIGRLHFVDAQEPGGVTEVSGQAYTYTFPLEGEVSETFSETQKDVTIKSSQNARVGAILSGTVVKTTADSVIVSNDNATRTTYQGVLPTVMAGDAVQSGQQIGNLSGEALCLETVSGIGYMDSLNAQQMQNTVVGR